MSVIRYMVWVENRGTPTVLHDEESEAVAEAERLCRKTLLPVHLLKTVSICKPPKPVLPPIVWEPAE